MIELRQYVDETGRDPFGRWFEKLEPSVQARIAVVLERLALGGQAAKGVGEGVLELRLVFGPGFRVYFGKDGPRLILLLGGGTKKRQGADILAAQQMWRQYKQRRRRDATDEELS